MDRVQQNINGEGRTVILEGTIKKESGSKIIPFRGIGNKYKYFILYSDGEL